MTGAAPPSAGAERAGLPPELPAAADARAGLVREGAREVLLAARLVAREPRLRRAALVPTLLTALGCAAVAALTAWDADDGATALHAFVVTFVALSSMPPTILFRQWARLGLEARRAHGASPGESGLLDAPFWPTLWRESGKALRQFLVVTLALAPILAAVELLPLAGDVVVWALGAAWAWYWVVLDALEIPVEVAPGERPDPGPPWFERRLRAAGERSRWLFPLRWTGALAGRLGRPWRAEAAFTERRPWQSLGFALAAGAVLAVPVLGLLFRAVALTAATGLLCRREGPTASA